METSSNSGRIRDIAKRSPKVGPLMNGESGMLKPSADSSVTKLRDAYLKAALDGDQTAAAKAIDQALALGVTPKNIYTHILTPAQYEVGELWHDGKIAISQEHAATQISLAEMGRLRPLLRRKASIGRRIVVSSVQGDPHVLGGRMVADVLYTEGWEVDFLGADTPSSELARFVAEKKPAVVGLSVTLVGHIEEAKRATELVRKALPGVKVVVGGLAVASNPEAVKKIGADAYVTRSSEANDIARVLVGLPKSAESLPELLKLVGARISRIRKEQRFSQQEIADASGLERAYISAVEHGKHNLTLGALMRLASALDVSIEELISQAE